MDWFTGSCTGSPNNISRENPWFPVKMFPSTNEAIPICLKINPNDPMNHHVSWLTPMVQYCSWNICLINGQVFGMFDQQVACKPFTTARQALPVAWPSVMSGHYARGFPGKSGENPWWMEVIKRLNVHCHVWLPDENLHRFWHVALPSWRGSLLAGPPRLQPHSEPPGWRWRDLRFLQGVVLKWP